MRICVAWLLKHATTSSGFSTDLRKEGHRVFRAGGADWTQLLRWHQPDSLV